MARSSNEKKKKKQLQKQLTENQLGSKFFVHCVRNVNIKDKLINVKDNVEDKLISLKTAMKYEFFSAIKDSRNNFQKN